jgi:hypothetical protein
MNTCDEGKRGCNVNPHIPIPSVTVRATEFNLIRKLNHMIHKVLQGALQILEAASN